MPGSLPPVPRPHPIPIPIPTPCPQLHQVRAPQPPPEQPPLLGGTPIMDGTPFLRATAMASGISGSELDEHAREGRLRRQHRQVLVDVRAIDDVELRARAISLILPPGAAIARETAAWLHGVDAREPGQHRELPELVCMVPAGVRAPLRREGVRCFQGDLGSDVVDVSGVPCTSALRTAVDLLRYAPPFIGLAAADTFAGLNLVTPEAVQTEVERWRGGRFVNRARRLAGLIEPASESAGESWLRLRIIDAGFPRPEVQIWVPKQGPGAYRLDLGYRKSRKGIEYDGEEFHDSPEQRQADAVRRHTLELEHDWQIVAVGKGEVLGTSMALEYALGEFLGMEPVIRRRPW